MITPDQQRNSIVQSLLAQYYASNPAAALGAPGFAPGEGGAPEPFTEQALPADPADYSSGFEQAGSALLGDLGGLAPEGFANSVDSQVVGDAVTSPGYGSSLGYAHAANVADQAMTALGIYDAIDTSNAVNNAVDMTGYNANPSPAPSPGYQSPDPNSTIVGLPSDFTTAQASLSSTTGADMGGAAIAADVAGLTGLNAGVNDAVAGYSSGFDAGVAAGMGIAAGGPGSEGGPSGDGASGGFSGDGGGFSGGVDAAGGVSW